MDLSWEHFCQNHFDFPSLGLALDTSRVGWKRPEDAPAAGALAQAFADMQALEAGAVSNPDEQRQVGHYWLRDATLAPHPELRAAIEASHDQIRQFVQEVHSGRLQGANGKPFTHLLLIGIGGSALGPQFVAHALGTLQDAMTVHFFDNTDPDGMDRVLNALNGQLAQTLVLVISKSGGTKETRNGMLEAQHAFLKAGLEFERHAVAITGAGSALSETAVSEGWLERFPMWDWVGGRTSETAVVGLLPAALQGLDWEGLLQGAREMDQVTRLPELSQNPAALLALAWHTLTQGNAEKAMVVLPYKDRLELFSRYLQQLVMESLGKETDLQGATVHQGLTVYGNKGSTDQHAYIQQLREGPNDFFAVFLEVLKDREGVTIDVEPGVTSGDYLHGFFQGTRTALAENGRASLTLTLEQVDAFRVGALIALFERAVGLYAFLVGINAYHQPGVEAGKVAAGAVIDLQGKSLSWFQQNNGRAVTAPELAQELGQTDQAETLFRILRHLAANQRVKQSGQGPEAQFQVS